MDNKKILALMGFAARARKICFGADSVETQIQKRKVKLVIIAQDASERTKEKFKTICTQSGVPIIIKGEIEVISNAIGKSNKAVIGIEDSNLANEIQKINNGGEFIGED